MIIIALKEHLERLKAIETLKAGKRKEVPSMDGLAKEVGLHRGTLNRIANNHGKAIKFEVLNSIIETLRELGFDTDISDILIYSPTKKPKTLFKRALEEEKAQST